MPCHLPAVDINEHLQLGPENASWVYAIPVSHTIRAANIKPMSIRVNMTLHTLAITNVGTWLPYKPILIYHIPTDLYTYIFGIPIEYLLRISPLPNPVHVARDS